MSYNSCCAHWIPNPEGRSHYTGALNSNLASKLLNSLLSSLSFGSVLSHNKSFIPSFSSPWTYLCTFLHPHIVLQSFSQSLGLTDATLSYCYYRRWSKWSEYMEIITHVKTLEDSSVWFSNGSSHWHSPVAHGIPVHRCFKRWQRAVFNLVDLLEIASSDIVNVCQ